MACTQAEAARRQDAEAAIDGSDTVAAPDADVATLGNADGQGAAKPPGPLHNQFNFSERAAQSAVHPPRDRGTNTEPPLTAETSGTDPTLPRRLSLGSGIASDSASKARLLCHSVMHTAVPSEPWRHVQWHALRCDA